ncbi:MAG TPA: AMP-binding protein [Candidatus Omnitrophota bacterium]|nr:AMP-binding protein [Candidatus Omnitrophota bacterium]HPD84333.1 AMP-binding protein [Candidatus Omnitrophota bacterium]HRZ03191.1 AMP-binding protein [Candidatus Omnitrophota bacterium]
MIDFSHASGAAIKSSFASNLNQEFLKTCQNFSSREAMRLKTASGWEIYSYRDILERSLKISSWLKEQGFGKDHKAAILLDNSPQWAVAYFGILLAGGVCVPLDPQLNAGDALKFINDAGADFIFIEKRLVEQASFFEKDVKKIVVLGPGPLARGFVSFQSIMLQPGGEDIHSLPIASERDTAAILYSSGTTSNPKGVELSQRNFVSNFNSIKELNVCSSKDVFVSILPLFHAYAFMATLVFPFFIGARIVYPRTIKSSELSGILKESGVTIMVGVPEIFSNIHRSMAQGIKDLPVSRKLFLSAATGLGQWLRKITGLNILKRIYRPFHERLGENLRLFISGGARLEPGVALGFEKFGFTILEGYGLTETAPLVTLNPPGKPKAGSVGKVVPGVEVEIMNPDADGIGEIAVRGSNVMKGYYHKPAETKEAVRGGWFYTGDLGYLDSQGYLYITGRIKELIVLDSGKNIFPEEIEGYYARSKFIKEIGIFLSPEEHGSCLKAVIVPDFEVFKEIGLINVREKIKWDVENISSQLPAYKRILGFAITKDELPKTRLGKIKRYQLPVIYRKESAQSSGMPIEAESEALDGIFESPTGQRILEFLQKELVSAGKIRATDHLELDLGVDSLKFVELVAGVEKMFGIRLADDVFAGVSTVKDLIGAIEDILAHPAAPGEGGGSFSRDSWGEILTGFEEKQFSSVELHPGFVSRLFGYFVKTLVYLVFKMVFRFTAAGRNNLSSVGPYVICCNHASYLDAFAILSALPFRLAFNTYFIGSKEIFDHPLLKWSIRLARIIPIDPSSELIKAMQASAHVLKHGKILCLFPEGQRSIDGQVKTFKKGTGILVKELGINVVPAAIDGAYEAWPRSARFPKPHPIKVIFGKPMAAQILLSSSTESAGDNKSNSIARRIREEVLLLKQQLRK